jgi:hypothetical protein
MDCPTQNCPWPDEAHLDSCPHHPARLAVLADLRTGVQTLRDGVDEEGRKHRGEILRASEWACKAYDDVLALLDEEQG